MPTSKYTPEQKAQALALYVSRGVQQAAEQTSIPAKTISSWASRQGLACAASETRQRSIAFSQEEFLARRERLKCKFAQRAEWCMDQVDKEFTEIVVDQKGYEHEITQRPKSADVKNYAIAAGTFFDKLQLATGGPTVNNETTIKAPNLKALIPGALSQEGSAMSEIEDDGSLEAAIAIQNRKNDEIKARVIAEAAQ